MYDRRVQPRRESTGRVSYASPVAVGRSPGRVARRGEARGRVAREARGREHGRARAQQLERDVVADLDARARDERDRACAGKDGGLSFPPRDEERAAMTTRLRGRTSRAASPS